MEVGSAPETRGLLGRWMKATFFGWLLGFAIVIVLALIWDAIGGTAQFMVGVGMGAGVGYVQGRQLHAWIARPRRWFWASLLGMGLPFTAWDLSAALGIDSVFSLLSCVVLGGCLVGALQWRLLRPISRLAFLWLPACAIGWSLPGLAIASSGIDGIPELWATTFQLVGMLGGGLLLGVVTGPALVRTIRGAEGAR